MISGEFFFNGLGLAELRTASMAVGAITLGKLGILFVPTMKYPEAKGI